jgi:putative endonuclease
MKIFTSKTQKTGELGEDEAVNYLVNKGFKIIERNHTRKWGELDIVAVKGNVLHFIEVKAITVRDISTREGNYRPEDHMDTWKIQRLKRVMQTYLMSADIKEDQEWQFDLICVYFLEGKLWKVEVVGDLIL